MNISIPEMPATAKQIYLEKLTEKIRDRLEETDDEQTKTRLHALLKSVEERQQQFRQHTKTFATPDPQIRSPLPPKTLEEADLSETQQQQVKKRLQSILADIKKQHSEIPLETPTSSSTSPSLNEDIQSLRTTLETEEFTDEEYHLVKDRMAEMLAEIQKQGKEDSHKSEAEEEPILELGPDLELILSSEQKIEPESDQDDDEQIIELGPEQTLELGPGDEIEGKPELSEENQDTQSETNQQTAPETLDFEAVCRRVSQGESLILFEKITLSEREQVMVEAFKDHLIQMKGLKRQQVFDMQHLTSRSIRELEQIFKTYHLQGYLRAELNNIYNRLLNLRSRISILQH